jgi:multidrug resistance protein MdtO
MALSTESVRRPLTAENGRPSWATFLSRELAPKPGRLASTLRIVVLTVLTVAICEVYRIPLPAYCAYIVFFVSQEETASTLLAGLYSAVAITIAVAGAILCYMLSAGEPGLRIPLMALAAFVGIFVSRTSSLGLIAFGAGFVLTIALTMIDVISPVGALPSAKVLTETVLWFWVDVMLPVGLVVIANVLTGRAPADLFRQTLVSSLGEAARLLKVDGKSRGDKSVVCPIASETTALLRYHKLTQVLREWPPRRAAANQSLIVLLHEITTLTSEWNRRGVTDPCLIAAAAAYGDFLLSLARALEAGATVSLEQSLPSLNTTLWDIDASATILLARLHDLAVPLLKLLSDQGITGQGIDDKQPSAPKLRRLFVEDAFSNPEHRRFALKVTIAAMITYILYNLLDWPNIRTAMITCFFVTLGNVGETLHKMTLRFAGALIGGALGLGTVVFLMPYLETIGDLCLVIALVTFLAAWIASGSERLAYCGMQIAMAYYFCILVGYGPTVNLAMARDRVVGILLGNIVVFLVFSNIWPVHVATQVHRTMSKAMRTLADIFLVKGFPSAGASHQAARAVFAFENAMVQACRLNSFELFEQLAGKRHELDRPDNELLEFVHALLGPAIIVLASGPLLISAGEKGRRLAVRANAYHNAFSLWLSGLAQQSLEGNRKTLLPEPPDASLLQSGFLQIEKESENLQCAALSSWYRELNKRALCLIKRLNLKNPAATCCTATGDGGAAI